MIFPPLETVEAGRIVEMAEQAPAQSQLRVSMKGETLEGDLVNKTVMLPVGEPATGIARLAEAGIEVRTEEGRVFVDNIVFGSAAEQAGVDFDWEILSLEVQADRLPKQLMFIPALLLLGLLALRQRSRRPEAATA
jgi:hypothetical protein